MSRKRYMPEQIIGQLRDELLNGEIFYTRKEAQILIERWRREYNTVRPHSALGYRPPAPEAIAVTPEILAPLCSARISGLTLLQL
jgi:putative transposase